MPETSIHMETAWIWPEDKTGIKEGVTFVEKHSHPFQQILSFFGSDLNDIHDLQGEVELRMFIDTWGTGGWEIDLRFDYEKGNVSHPYSQVDVLKCTFLFTISEIDIFVDNLPLNF